jgi:hypothetical protein
LSALVMAWLRDGAWVNVTSGAVGEKVFMYTRGKAAIAEVGFQVGVIVGDRLNSTVAAPSLTLVMALCM